MIQKQTTLSNGCPLVCYPDADRLGEVLARDILDGIATAGTRGYRLGCPSGRSLQTTYAALGTLATQSRADLSGLTIVMMDEYVFDTADGLVPCPPDAHYSGRRFALHEIRDVLNAGLPHGKRVREENVWLPDPAEPLAYETAIKDAGGIDLFLIASGASDGHVAFNGPGAGPDMDTHVRPLPDTIRRDNMKTFPDFASLDEVPTHGVTVGLGTITKQSRRVALVICGAHKRAAVRRLLTCTDFTPDWPASIIYRARNGGVFIDEAAGGGTNAEQNA